MNNRWFVIGISIVLIVTVFVFFPRKKQTPDMAESPKTSETRAASADALYQEARERSAREDVLASQNLHQEILEKYPDYERVEDVQSELERLNLEIILSGRETPETIVHEVQPGDTLGKLAKKYGTTVELIQLKNGLKSDLIRIGQRLKIWQGNFNILVDKSQNTLILKDGNRVVKSYTVATGEENSTPVGTFEIISKLVDPVWFKAGAIIPPDSPQNVLGTRWLGFDIPGYGIHGTTEPDTVGRQVTAGCVRMRNEEVEEVFNIVPTGTKVTIIN